MASPLMSRAIVETLDRLDVELAFVEDVRDRFADLGRRYQDYTQAADRVFTPLEADPRLGVQTQPGPGAGDGGRREPGRFEQRSNGKPCLGDPARQG